MIHFKKIERTYLELIVENKKTFEVRNVENCNDIIECGDYILLQEIDLRGQYTGRGLLIRVKYILSDTRFCKSGFIIFSFDVLDFYGDFI